MDHWDPFGDSLAPLPTSQDDPTKDFQSDIAWPGLKENIESNNETSTNIDDLTQPSDYQQDANIDNFFVNNTSASDNVASDYNLDQSNHSDEVRESETKSSTITAERKVCLSRSVSQHISQKT